MTSIPKINAFAPEDCLIIEVSVQDEFISTLVATMFDILRLRLPCSNEFSVEKQTKLELYLRTLLRKRVGVIKGEVRASELQGLQVPFWFSDIMSKIGECHYVDENILIRPVLTDSEFEMLSREALAEESRSLAVIGKYYQMEPMPTNKVGNGDFMETLTLANGSLRSHTKKDGIEVFQSLLVEKRLLQASLADMFRFSYGDFKCLRDRYLLSEIPRFLDNASRGGTKINGKSSD